MSKLKIYLGALRRKPGQIYSDYKYRKNISKMGHDSPKIFYFGVPEHSNLGDLAQCYCIRQFLADEFADYKVVEVASRRYLNNVFGTRNFIKKTMTKDDIIVFQSGYCTQDIGGNEDAMHQLVMHDFPENKLLMLPQTVFFQNEDRKKKASEVYNAHKHLLFLARDQVSYELAREMFPDRKVELYPDIVTSLIGQYSYTHDRNGVLFCIRNDSEKFYSDKEIELLVDKIEPLAKCDRLDTTIRVEFQTILNDLKKYIEGYFERFSKYQVVITDRYHGTIFSLIANTPVIVIKTTDHKVKTGVDWFKGVYDESKIVYAESLDEAYKLACERLQNEKFDSNKSYFKEQYYAKLRALLEVIS